MHAEQAAPRGCSFMDQLGKVGNGNSCWVWFFLFCFWSPGKHWNSLLGVSKRLGRLQEWGGFFIPYSCSVFQQKVGIKSKKIGIFLGQNSTLKQGQEFKNLFHICCNVAVQISQKTDRQCIQVLGNSFLIYSVSRAWTSLLVRKVGICSLGKKKNLQNLPVLMCPELGLKWAFTPIPSSAGAPVWNSEEELEFSSCQEVKTPLPAGEMTNTQNISAFLSLTTSLWGGVWGKFAASWNPCGISWNSR